ncbi:MAG: hypothetical protein RL095_3496 [Verrucomicrobiota bacterium]|jgi:serine/threonine protein kinase
MLKVACPQCETRHQHPEEEALEKVSCKVCGRAYRVPMPFGPYLLLERRSGDAISEVYAAAFEGQGCRVRLLRGEASHNPEASQAFFAAADKWRSLPPGICSPFVSHGTHQGRPYAHYQPQGRTLKAVLAEEAISENKAMNLLLQTAERLRDLHGAEQICGNLKPSTLRLQQDQILLDDPGLCAAVQSSLYRQCLAPRPCPNPRFAAPEVWNGQEAGAAADRYAFGCLMLRLLGGRHPFEVDAELMAEAHCRRSPPSLNELKPHLPACLDDMIKALLQKDPQQRPRWLEVIAAIQRGIDESGRQGAEIRRQLEPSANSTLKPKIPVQESPVEPPPATDEATQVIVPEAPPPAPHIPSTSVFAATEAPAADTEEAHPLRPILIAAIAFLAFLIVALAAVLFIR